MRIELILLGLIAVVLIVDFILRGIKKKDTSEKGIEKFEGAFEESIKQSKLHYILGRKRNILTFILLLMLVKPIIHYVFVEEKGEISENVIKKYCQLASKAKMEIMEVGHGNGIGASCITTGKTRVSLKKTLTLALSVLRKNHPH